MQLLEYLPAACVLPTNIILATTEMMNIPQTVLLHSRVLVAKLRLLESSLLLGLFIFATIYDIG